MPSFEGRNISPVVFAVSTHPDLPTVLLDAELFLPLPLLDAAHVFPAGE